jgi:3-isopropylmalate/(R)-2-methylmalate dehydratase large subunit
VWNYCLQNGLIKIFKSAGALFGNAGCAGCASGQIGQNGSEEITVSTGNRNFEGKQGKGKVYLASVSTAVATAIAGHITTADNIPEHPSVFSAHPSTIRHSLAGSQPQTTTKQKSMLLEGKVWLIMRDNIDTDMIYHNRHLAVTDMKEMGRYALGNLTGWEDYPLKSEPGDIIIAGKNFGAGSSRQHAVDCFASLGNQAVLAESFGAIYERNAINAGFPVLTYSDIHGLDLRDRDTVVIDLKNGIVTNKKNGKSVEIGKFSEVQRMIYEKGDLLQG